MTKQLKLNTISNGSSNTYNPYYTAIVNHNTVITKPLKLVRKDYSYVDISDNGDIIIFIDNPQPVDTNTNLLVYNNGSVPIQAGPEQNNADYETKISSDINIDNNTYLINS